MDDGNDNGHDQTNDVNSCYTDGFPVVKKEYTDVTLVGKEDYTDCVRTEVRVGKLSKDVFNPAPESPREEKQDMKVCRRTGALEDWRTGGMEE